MVNSTLVKAFEVSHWKIDPPIRAGITAASSSKYRGNAVSSAGKGQGSGADVELYPTAERLRMGLFRTECRERWAEKAGVSLGVRGALQEGNEEYRDQYDTTRRTSRLVPQLVREFFPPWVFLDNQTGRYWAAGWKISFNVSRYVYNQSAFRQKSLEREQATAYKRFERLFPIRVLSIIERLGYRIAT